MALAHFRLRFHYLRSTSVSFLCFVPGRAGASGNLEYHLVVREQSDAPLSSQDQQQQREAQWSVRADGRVVAAGALDREVRDSYVLALLASDRGDPPLSTSASVLVRVRQLSSRPHSMLFHYTSISVVRRFKGNAKLGI